MRASRDAAEAAQSLPCAPAGAAEQRYGTVATLSPQPRWGSPHAKGPPTEGRPSRAPLPLHYPLLQQLHC